MLPLVLFILLGVNMILTSSALCDRNPNCTCAYVQPNSYEIVCTKSQEKEIMFIAVYRPGISLQIQCRGPGNIDYSLLEGLNIGPVNVLGLRFCPLPGTTFKEFMKSLQIDLVTKIEFKSYSKLEVSLPPGLFENLEPVTQISLTNNGLSSLPENLFDGMPKLTFVSLSNNKLKSIPKHIFRRTPELQILELGSNQLENLEPGVFKNLTHLLLLNLWNNQLVNVTRSNLVDIPNLENLDLSHNHLETLPPDVFTDLVKLTALNLNHNKLTHLPLGLFNSTTSLERLRLSHNEKVIQTLPDRLLSNLTMLSEVSISHCNISTLPNDLFWGTTNIVSVSFEGNQLTALPGDFFQDTKELQIVDFSRNKLESLPDSIFASTSKIRKIRLSHNGLHKISNQTFRGLSQLKTLDLGHNELNNIEKDAFINLESLTEINLSNNKLTFIDNTDDSPFKYCRRLNNILLSNNSIQHVLQDWKVLTSLRTLDLSGNDIKILDTDDLSFESNDVTVNLTKNKIVGVNLHHIKKCAQRLVENKTEVDYKRERKSIDILIADNPIQCDCGITHLVEYYAGHLEPEVYSLVNIDVGETQCSGPAVLKNVKISNLTLQDLKCQ